MRKIMALILSLALIISVAGCGKAAAETNANSSGTKEAVSADATSTNADGAVVTDAEKDSGITTEDLTTGIIYNRSDLSDAFWDIKADDAAFTNREIADGRFLSTLGRPYTSEGKIQIAQTYKFYMQAYDMFHVTINKDGIFYPVKDTVLSKNDDLELAYQGTDLFISSTKLELQEYSNIDTGVFDFDTTLAQMERNSIEYTTKELNGWKVIISEFAYESEENNGFSFEFFYDLNEYDFITCEANLLCDQAGADLFIDKFTNNFVFEKVDDSAAIAGVELENFSKIKLSDNITLNLENGTNFGVLVPDGLSATMVNFTPNALTFDGVDTAYVKAVEMVKEQGEALLGDTSYTYKDFTYKGIKTTLQFYDSEYDMLDLISGEETGETGIKTKLVGIMFETDSFTYALYPMSAEGEVTTDQDYEAYVTLIMDRMLEVT